MKINVTYNSLTNQLICAAGSVGAVGPRDEAMSLKGKAGLLLAEKGAELCLLEEADAGGKLLKDERCGLTAPLALISAPFLP